MGDELLRKLQLLLHGAVGTAGSRVGQVQSKDVWEERSEVRHMVVGACIKYYYVVIEGYLVSSPRGGRGIHTHSDQGSTATLILCTAQLVQVAETAAPKADLRGALPAGTSSP